MGFWFLKQRPKTKAKDQTDQLFFEVKLMNRRFFIKSGGIALASFGVMNTAPTFFRRALAETVGTVTGGRRKTLIAIFQRGAVDGLNMVVPYAESTYYDLRPNIAIPKPAIAIIIP